MNIWEEVKNLHGLTLLTLMDGKPFSISLVGGDSVFVTPSSTGKTRPLSKIIFEISYRLLIENRELRQGRIREETNSQNSSYILAILHKLTNAIFFKKGNAAFIKLP